MGVHAVCQNQNKVTLATPHTETGRVQMSHYVDNKIQSEAGIVIAAHTNAIA